MADDGRQLESDLRIALLTGAAGWRDRNSNYGAAEMAVIAVLAASVAAVITVLVVSAGLPARGAAWTGAVRWVAAAVGSATLLAAVVPTLAWLLGRRRRPARSIWPLAGARVVATTTAAGCWTVLLGTAAPRPAWILGSVVGVLQSPTRHHRTHGVGAAMGGFAGRRSTRPRTGWPRRGMVALAVACLLAVVGCGPASVAPPEIVGLPEVGQTLAASPGGWDGEPTSFSYTWRSCEAGTDAGTEAGAGAGDGCVTRQEGAASTYVVAPADRDRRLRVTVTASNGSGNQTADSALTAIVHDDTDPSIAWHGWATSPDHARELGELDVAAEQATVELRVDPAQRHQSWLGVGGALTDSSVALLERAGPDLLSALFDPNRASGARLGLVRLPLSATDFSTRAWTWQDDPTGPVAPPPEALRAVAALRQAAALRPDLQAVGASWSAPAWMKDSGQLNGGALAPGTEGPYEDLLVDQAKILRSAGVPLLAITLGNEPGHSASDYPTMTMTDEQMIGLAPGVHERLATKGVELWALDHNWADRARADALLAGAPGAFDAVAFHCYAGEPASMGGLAVPAVMTECTGGDWDPSWASTFRWQARNLVVDATANGSTGLLLWNLALDPARGPHTGGCGNCRGIVTVDPATGDWTPEPEYYLLAQLSRAADPGAIRVGLTASPAVPAVAFANPDGTVGIFGHNDTGQRQVVTVSFAAGHATRVAVQPGELFTLRGSPLDG